MNKKISYITLVSDLYILLTISYIIYGVFFGFERIGASSFTITSINNNIAIIISLAEIVFNIIIAYLLHKCSYKTIRIILMLLCILNIIYRISNLLFMINPFTLFIVIINIALFIILLFY